MAATFLALQKPVKFNVIDKYFYTLWNKKRSARFMFGKD